jgi:hypothetical protein
VPTRGPPSRTGGQDINIDLLIAKLLEIPNEELLDSFLQLSPQEEAGDHSRNSEIEDQ